MTGEIRTLSLTVDLDCGICSKKIKKAICKLQKRESIQKVEYNEKEKKVTISGPFDPVKLKNKLCCKACEAIKSINIVEKEKEPEKKKPVEKPPPESRTKEPEKKKPVKKPLPESGTKEPEKKKPVEKPPPESGTKEPEKKKSVQKPPPESGTKEPKKKKPVKKPPPESGTKKPEPVYLSVLLVGLTMPVCRCRPCYVGCHDICRCCTYGCGGAGPHSLPVVGKPVIYQFSYEEAPPPCSIM